MKGFLQENGLVILILLLMIGAYAYFRTPGSDLESVEAFDEQASGGQPTVLELYSNT